MVPTSRARTALRAATAGHHDRVDRLFSLFDLRGRSGYARFLQAQAAALLPAEAALTRAGAGAVVPDWLDRRRGDALLADLAGLGVAAPPACAAPAFAGPAAILGGVYVLEGSRLGGRLLRRQVPAGLPAAFLDHAAPAAWPRLLALLEERLVTDAQRAGAIEAAARTFALFEAAATPAGG